MLEKLWREMTKSVIKVPSSGNLLYGSVEWVTDRGLMLVRTSHRRRWIETHKWRRIDGKRKKVLAHRYMTDWERLSPPKLLCAWQGKYSMVKPPEEEVKNEAAE